MGVRVPPLPRAPDPRPTEVVDVIDEAPNRLPYTGGIVTHQRPQVLLLLIAFVGVSCGEGQKENPTSKSNMPTSAQEESKPAADDGSEADAPRVIEHSQAVHPSHERGFVLGDTEFKSPFQLQLNPDLLGKERAAFGDKEGAEEWSFRGMTMPIWGILFPAGSSDRRYYWNTDAYELIYATRTGDDIQLRWRLETEVMTGEERAALIKRDDAGTLELFLAGYGRKALANMPNVIQRCLKERVGYAHYQYHLAVSGFASGYITPDAQYLESQQQEEPPETVYKVTEWERKVLEKMKEKHGP